MFRKLRFHFFFAKLAHQIDKIFFGPDADPKESEHKDTNEKQYERKKYMTKHIRKQYRNQANIWLLFLVRLAIRSFYFNFHIYIEMLLLFLLLIVHFLCRSVCVRIHNCFPPPIVCGAICEYTYAWNRYEKKPLVIGIHFQYCTVRRKRNATVTPYKWQRRVNRAESCYTSTFTQTWFLTLMYSYSIGDEAALKWLFFLLFKLNFILFLLFLSISLLVFM